MSDALLAILPHNFKSAEDVLRLPEIVRPLVDEANAFERLYLPGTRPCADDWKWALYRAKGTPQEDWARYQCVWLDGPLSIGIGAGSLMLIPTAKWNWVRRQQPVLAAAASFFDLAARTFAVSCYVVTHSGDPWNYVIEGLTVDAIEKAMQERGYVRAATLPDLYDPAPHLAEYAHDVYCRVLV